MNWCYWVDIWAGARNWVDFDGNDLDRICISVLPTGFTPAQLPKTLVLPLGLDPSSIDAQLENHPISFLPRIPDFSFSFNAGYTSPDGTFTAQDVLSALAQYNATQGKYFDIVGCVCSVVVGYSDHVGIWYDGGWKSSGGNFTTTAPAPAQNDDVRVIHSAIISAVDKSGIDQISVSTTYPDDSATIGEEITSDGNDSAKVVAYSDKETTVEVELNNGVIPLFAVVDSVDLYYKPSQNGSLIPVDTGSYNADALEIDLRKGSQNTTFSYLGIGHEDYELYNYNLVPPYRPQSFPDAQDRIDTYSVVVDGNVETIIVGINGPGIGVKSSSGGVITEWYYPQIADLKTPSTTFNGRGFAGTNRIASDGNSYTAEIRPSSVRDESKYNILLNLTAYPVGAYSETVPDDFLPEGYIATSIGGNGDLTELNVNSKRTVPNFSKTWNTIYGRYAPVAIYGDWKEFTYTTLDEYLPNTNRLVIRFPEFENIDGKVEEVKIYLQSEWRHNIRGYEVILNPPSTPIIKTYSSRAILRTEGENPIAYALHTETNATANLVYYINNRTWSNPITLTNRIDAKDLAKIIIDADFNAFRDNEGDTDVFGSFAVYAIKVVAKVRTIVKDGDKFAVSIKSVTSGEPYYVIEDVVNKYCQSMSISDGDITGFPVSAVVSRTEPLRDFIRDVLSQGRAIIKPLLGLSQTGLSFTVNAIDGVQAPTVIDCDGNVFTDIIPLASVATCPMSDIYNAFKVRFGYDVGLGRYTKIAYVDSSGYVLTGFDYSVFRGAPDKCAFADGIVGKRKRVKSVDLRFSSERNAMSYLETMAGYMAYPRKSAEVNVTLRAFDYLQVLSFTGSKLPADLLASTWMVMGWSHNIDEGETVLQLREVPQWP